MSSRVRASISVVHALGHADVQRPEAALVVRGDGDVVEDPLDLVLAEAVVEQPLARAAHDELLGAGAGGDALGGDADEPPRAGGRGHGDAVEGVDLLRRDARHGGGLVLGVARGDRHLGARGALALAHELGDAGGERLGLEGRLAEHDLADHLVDDLLEARHVRALLLCAEVDEALQPRGKELLLAVLADADDLLDPRDADARQADPQARRLRLNVGTWRAQAL